MGQILSGDGNGKASESIHWCSPLWITDGSAEVFRARPGVTGVDLDPCANPGSLKRVNAKVGLCLPDNDGLADDWRRPVIGIAEPQDLQSCYCNSPFGAYWFHPGTKDILAPGEVEDKAFASLLAGPWQDIGEGPLRQMTEQQKKAAKKDKELSKVLAKAKKQVVAGYDRHTIADWIDKCAEAGAKGMDVIQMGPVSPGTAHWQDVILPTAAAILWIKGRPRFEMVDFETMEVVSVGDPAPMDCSLALWTKDERVLRAFGRVFAGRGKVTILDSGYDGVGYDGVGYDGVGYDVDYQPSKALKELQDLIDTMETK